MVKSISTYAFRVSPYGFIISTYGSSSQLLQRILKGKVKESLVKCRYCNSDIKIVSLGMGWQPRELDGSLHRCEQYKPKDKTE